MTEFEVVTVPAAEAKKLNKINVASTTGDYGQPETELSPIIFPHR